MKKIGILVFLFLISNVGALSTTLEDSYLPRETIIAQLSEDVIGTIRAEQINLLREGHIDVGFEYGVGKIGYKNYFWLIAPQGSGNYTLRFEDVVVSVEGVPEIVDYSEGFVVVGESASYSINPGVVVASEDFEINVRLYDDFSKSASLDFPEARDVTLFPGENIVSFDVSGFFGNQLIDVTFGDYVFPVYLMLPESVCGDGLVTGKEVCDGENLGENTCSSVNASYDGGDLNCSEDCLSFDDSECSIQGVVIEKFCDKDNLDLCLNEDDCEYYNGYWYDDLCHRGAKGDVCDSEHLELCETIEECVDVRGFWYNEKCNLEKEIVEGTPEFEFEPSEMDLTFLIGSSATYSFRITNTGDVPINDLDLDFNIAKFNIEPSGNIEIGVNESKVFDLTLAGSLKGETQGAVVASVGEISEYLLITLRGTENEEEVETNYGSEYKCVELGGVVCDSDQTCSSTLVDASDTDECCVGLCQTSGGNGSSTWIGYLILGIVVVGGLILFLKYRKTGKPKSSVKERFASAEKKLP